MFFGMSLSSIKLLFPCKKLRRSHRIEIRETVESKCKAIEDGPLGFFEILPLELKFLIFTYLPISELSLLTITSKSVRNVVELYRNTSWAQRFLLPRPMIHQMVPIADHEYYTQQFQQLGLLMKRSTCLYTTKDRLRLVQQFLQKYLCNFHKSCEEPTKCIALVCYGKFLFTVTAGWDDKECLKVYDSVTNNTLMAKHLESLVKFKQGAYQSLELHVRLFYRRVFINQSSANQDRAFWLNTVLKPYPMVHQARILFLLFGPTCGEEIQWHDVCESTPVSKDQAVACFGELANAFRILHHHSTDWKEDDIISVIDELTSSPDEWLSENVAHLLYLCGDCIIFKVLNSKAINGRILELANILTSLCLVCIRHDHSLSWVVELVTGVCSVIENNRDKVNLLVSIIDVFKEFIMDLHEYGDGEETLSELEVMLDAQAKFTKELIMLAFQNLLTP